MNKEHLHNYIKLCKSTNYETINNILSEINLVGAGNVSQKYGINIDQINGLIEVQKNEKYLGENINGPKYVFDMYHQMKGGNPKYDDTTDDVSAHIQKYVKKNISKHINKHLEQQKAKLHTHITQTAKKYLGDNELSDAVISATGHALHKVKIPSSIASTSQRQPQQAPRSAHITPHEHEHKHSNFTSAQINEIYERILPRLKDDFQEK